MFNLKFKFLRSKKRTFNKPFRTLLTERKGTPRSPVDVDETICSVLEW